MTVQDKIHGALDDTIGYNHKAMALSARSLSAILAHRDSGMPGSGLCQAHHMGDTALQPAHHLHRMTMRLLLTGLLTILLCGACAGIDPTQRRAHAQTLAHEAGWNRLTLPAGTFTLTAYTPAVQPAMPMLTIYIEGDGYAWQTPHTPSADPTPTQPMALQLALRHADSAAAYLARPCQYLDGISENVCSERYWTTARYAPEVIAATSLAIDQLKQRAGARRLTLIGYSGGGAVAALVAAGRDDVARLITLAANLDTTAWAREKHLQALAGSLNPADFWPRLQAIPQQHFAGANDRVVPPTVQRSYAARFPSGQRPAVIVVPNFDHQCCWLAQWPQLLLNTKD
jgi:hypothetical protein